MAFFNLGLQEFIILGFMGLAGLVAVVVVVVVVFMAGSGKNKDD